MRRFIVSEQSMAPALVPGDRYLTRRARRAPRGSIAFFLHPHRQEFWLVKRVIGLPGESVVIQRGRVEIDGQELGEPWTTDATAPEGTWEVPAGHVFVLSDARHRSLSDSRTFGPICIDGAYVGWIRYRRATS